VDSSRSTGQTLQSMAARRDMAWGKACTVVGVAPVQMFLAGEAATWGLVSALVSVVLARGVALRDVSRPSQL
jgi:hypothetical protein